MGLLTVHPQIPVSTLKALPDTPGFLVAPWALLAILAAFKELLASLGIWDQSGHPYGCMIACNICLNSWWPFRLKTWAAYPQAVTRCEIDIAQPEHKTLLEAFHEIPWDPQACPFGRGPLIQL